MRVHFSQPNQVADAFFKYAVIAARYQDQWVFCRHKARNTWEIPGGHREKGESIADTAAREPGSYGLLRRRGHGRRSRFCH